MPRCVRLGMMALALFASACAGGGPGAARLSTTGPDVRLNGRPASDGAILDQNDRVSTGANSSARIAFSDRTRIQLDENSDPLVSWDGAVIAINIGYGWFLIDTGQREVRVANVLAEGVFQSRGAVHVVPGQRFEVYLLSGRFTLERPAGAVLTGGQSLTVRNGRVTLGVIGDAERAEIEQRFARWRFAALSPLRPDRGEGTQHAGVGGFEPAAGGETGTATTDTGGTDTGGTGTGGSDTGGTDTGGTGTGGTDDVGADTGGGVDPGIDFGGVTAPESGTVLH